MTEAGRPTKYKPEYGRFHVDDIPKGLGPVVYGLSDQDGAL